MASNINFYDPGVYGEVPKFESSRSTELENPIPYSLSDITIQFEYNAQLFPVKNTEVTAYDEFGIPIQIEKEEIVTATTLKDNVFNRVYAKVTNATKEEIAYAQSEGPLSVFNWQIDENTVQKAVMSDAFSGNSSYFLDNSTSPKFICSNLPEGKYVLSYWAKQVGISVTANNNGDVDGPYKIERGIWDYYEYYVDFTSTGNNTVSLGGTNQYLDELKLYPFEGSISTIGYYPNGQVQHKSDGSLHFETYEYDEKDRLQWTLNDQKDVLSYQTYVSKDSSDINSYNKVLTKTAKEEGLSKADALNASTSSSDFNTVVIYSDGFGREVQRIEYNQTASGKERVSFKEYDVLGRELKQYLPYYKHIINNNTDFIINAKAEQQNYYSSLNDPLAATDSAFVRTVVEQTPFQRPVEKGSIGEEFQPGGDHTTKFEYGWNSATDLINWQWQENQYGQISFSAAQHFAPFALEHKTVIDPSHGLPTKVFTDNFGNEIITEQTAHTSTTGSGSDAMLYTGSGNDNTLQHVRSYKVYDLFNRLVAEIPAEAVEALHPGTSFTGTSSIFKEFITYYRYDARGRISEKHSPGIGWVYYVYNKYNQLVLSQDAIQRQEDQWSFQKYDELGRTIMTGLEKLPGETRATLQSAVDGSTAFWEERTAPDSGVFGYTSSAFPTTIIENDVLNVYYFDDYTFGTGNFSFVPFGSYSSPTQITRGLPTGSRTRILETNSHLLTVSYYDDYGNIIQAFTKNHKTGYDRLDNSYNQRQQLTESLQHHKYKSTSSEVLVKNRYLYNSNTGSLGAVYSKVNNDPEVLLYQNNYNDPGQLIDLKLFQGPGNSVFMQNIDYRYNAQGKLTHINNADLLIDAFNNEDTDVFGQELFYHKYRSSYAEPAYGSTHQIKLQYNGNISAMLWKAKTPDQDGAILEKHAFVYRYDNFGQMTAGLYAADSPSNPGVFNKMTGSYTEEAEYFLGGRIKHMRRIMPGKNQTLIVIDNLDYLYKNGGKSYQLERIDESGVDDKQHFKHFVNHPGPTDFQYDAAGRMILDNNKTIILSYNDLNLPRRVNYSHDDAEILYTYDAAGNKLQKESNDVAMPGVKTYPSVTTDYISNFVYINGTLDHIIHPQGILRPTPSGANNTTEFVYDFFIKDYLGNVRVVLTEEDAQFDSGPPVAMVATMELDSASSEENTFENIAETRDDKPVGYPSTYGDDPNYKVSSLNSDGQTGGMGPSLLVKVERGAELSVSAEYFYKEEIEGSTYESMGMFVNQILAGLASNATGVLPLSEAALMEMTSGQGEYFDEVFNFLSSSMDPENLTKPQAYLVYLFYDLNMNLVENSSGVLRVQDPNDLGLLKEEQIVAKEAGYFYTYLMNSSGSEVNFDDYQVTYIRPKVRAINHYYPYGLQMYGIDQLDKDYKYKYGGKELQTGDILDNNSTGLELYDIEARYYDPATGLWHVPDPAEQFSNPYLAMGNNPVVYVDPDGEFIGMAIFLGATINFMVQGMSGNINSAGDAALSLGIGAASAAAGFGAGAAVGGGIGFFSGAVQGAASGAAGGFIGGAGNTWAGGGSFGDGIMTGLRSGAIGAATGAAIGGVSSGIRAVKSEGNFWNGDGARSYSFANPGDAGVSGTPENYNYEYLAEFADQNFPSAAELRESVNSLNASSGSNATFTETGHFMVSSGPEAGKLAWGYTEFNRAAKGFDIFISKAALVSNQQLYLTMGHEFLHVAYSLSGIPLTGHQEHASIYKWQFEQAKKFYMGGSARSVFRSNISHYNSSHDHVWQKLFPIRTSTSFPW